MLESLISYSVSLGSDVAVPLLKAVIVKADKALVTAFTGILVANAITLLC
jgi:hypothetical protein